MANHKFIAKVDLANGKSRYFYSENDYNAYKKSTTSTLVPGAKAKKTTIIRRNNKKYGTSAKEHDYSKDIYDETGNRKKHINSFTYSYKDGSKNKTKYIDTKNKKVVIGSALVKDKMRKMYKEVLNSKTLENGKLLVKSTRESRNGISKVAAIINGTDTKYVSRTFKKKKNTKYAKSNIK